MRDVPIITAAVTFLGPREGGRVRSAVDAPTYRPHLVVGDPGQRYAVVDEAGVATENYLGVHFAGTGRELSLCVEHVVQLGLTYSPDVDYSELQPGMTFTIREGPRVVGFGRVLE